MNGILNNYKSWVVVLLLLICYSSNSQNLPLESTEISILTCKSGDELYTTFGHSALRISNRETGFDKVFNYGIFNFDTPNFYPLFLRGKLPYYLGVSSMSSFLREYQREERTVLEQKLNLNKDEKEVIINYLRENLKPENVTYNYDFFYDNCTTRLIDLLNEMDGDIVYDTLYSTYTFRDLLKQNLTALPWSEFGIDLVIGAKADNVTDRRDQMFLPQYLMQYFDRANIKNQDTTKTLIQSEKVLINYEDADKRRKSNSLPWPLIVFGCLLMVSILLNFSNSRFASLFNRALLLFAGLVGLFMAFMWFGTDHQATKVNWNLLWMSPLFLILLLIKGNARKVLAYFLLFCLLVSAINCMFTFLPQFYHLAFLPIILSLALAVLKYSNLIGRKKMSV